MGSIDESTLSELKTRISVLEDEIAISKTLSRFAQQIDHHGGFDDVFAEEGISELFSLQGTSIHKETGLEELRAYMARSHGPDAHSTISEKHVVSMPVITVDGDTAQSDSYFTAFKDYGTGPCVVAFGQYFDRLVKRDGRWLINERKAIMGSTWMRRREA